MAGVRHDRLEDEGHLAMTRHKDLDQAFENLLKWAGREEWGARHRDIQGEHLLGVCKRFGLALDDLTGELAEGGYLHSAFALVFEDLATRRYPPDDANLVDDYLKRRGWREGPRGRRYLEALRDSRLGLYEVVEVLPGEAVDVRDVVWGGEIVRVSAPLASQELLQWDRVAARVVPMGDSHLFTASLVRFPAEPAATMLRILERTRKGLRDTALRAGPEDGTDQRTLDERVRRILPTLTNHAFTEVWVSHVLEQSRRPPPQPGTDPR
jgi:hypothetical protein